MQQAIKRIPCQLEPAFVYDKGSTALIIYACAALLVLYICWWRRRRRRVLLAKQVPAIPLHASSSSDTSDPKARLTRSLPDSTPSSGGSDKGGSQKSELDAADLLDASQIT